MLFAVLGPFDVRSGDRSLAPTATKPRQVLALLTLRAGQLVTTCTLMEELWGDTLPRSASTTLQTYVLRLRRLLAEGAEHERLSAESAPVIRTRPGGYLLEMPGGRSDAEEFERLSAGGRSAFAAGDYGGAVRLLSAALALWRGPALTDVPTGPVLVIEALRLGEMRLADIELRITAEFRLGREGTLIGELAVLTAEHPMHEGLHHHFMLALHRSGQSWRALLVFQRLRVTLLEELGMEPSPRIRELRQAILEGDPALQQPGVPSAEGIA